MANLLVVQEPGVLREAIVKALSRGGHVVRTADEAGVAAAELLINPVDLAVVHHVHGAALNAMAADPLCAWLKLTPVVLISAQHEETPDDARLHVRAVLVKSRFSLRELAARVDMALSA